MRITNENREAILLQIIQKWNQFLSTIHFRAEITLAEKMASFEPLCIEFLSNSVGLQKNSKDQVMFGRTLIALAIEATGQYPRNAALDAAKSLGWTDGALKPSLSGRIRQHLDSPLKRMAGIIFCLGFLPFLLGLANIIYDSYSVADFANHWLGAVFRTDRYDVGRYWLAAWGTYFVAFGAMFSIWYDSTLGRIFRWVRYGR